MVSGGGIRETFGVNGWRSMAGDFGSVPRGHARSSNSGEVVDMEV